MLLSDTEHSHQSLTRLALLLLRPLPVPFASSIVIDEGKLTSVGTDRGLGIIALEDGLGKMKIDCSRSLASVSSGWARVRVQRIFMLSVSASASGSACDSDAERCLGR